VTDFSIFGWTISLNKGYTVPNNRQIHIEIRQKVISYFFSYTSSVRLKQFCMIWRVQADHILLRQSTVISIFFRLEKERRTDIITSVSPLWIVWESLVIWSSRETAHASDPWNSSEHYQMEWSNSTRFCSSYLTWKRVLRCLCCHCKMNILF